MADDWIDKLRKHIVANGLGTYGTDLFKAGLEDGTGVGDPTIGMIEYSGKTTETMGNSVDDPKLHIAGRGSSYDTTRQRMSAIRDLLKVIKNTDIQGMHFTRVAPNGTIHYLNRDGSNRHQFTMNFEVWL